MNNRLKLYDSTIRIYISKKDKVKFRKIAFKNKMTVSELSRKLILLIIKLDESNKIDLRQDLTDNDIKTILNSMGGVFHF